MTPDPLAFDTPCALPPSMCSPWMPWASRPGCFLTVRGCPYIVAAYSTRGLRHPQVLTSKNVRGHCQVSPGEQNSIWCIHNHFFLFFFFLRRMGSWTLVCLASYSFFMPLLKWHLSREAVRSRPGKGHGVLSPWVPTPYGFAPALALLLWQCVCLFVVPQPHDETCAPRG